ncbi:MAG: hypothetical protein CM15mP54_26160 [Paracoccaceae bacterium]|nr:MAG: hypothetical protein CM15mP54_26160 [Paracoccaceae bacterium]
MQPVGGYMKQFCSLFANGMPSERLGEFFRVIC